MCGAQSQCRFRVPEFQPLNYRLTIFWAVAGGAGTAIPRRTNAGARLTLPINARQGTAAGTSMWDFSFVCSHRLFVLLCGSLVLRMGTCCVCAFGADCNSHMGNRRCGFWPDC